MISLNLEYIIQLYLTVSITLITSLLLLPLVLSYIVSKVFSLLEMSMLKKMSQNQESLLMAPGIIIHELSHLIFALIFGHKITSVKLFQLPDENGTRGYVNSSYNDSLYQKLGNCYVSIAPAIVITSIVSYDIYYLYHTLFVTPHFSWWIILAILVLCTTINGVIISGADWNGFKAGVVACVMSLLLLAVLITFILIAIQYVTGNNLIELIQNNI